MTQTEKTRNDQQQELPPGRPTVDPLDARVAPVKDLIRERRRIAAVFQRSQSDSDRRELAEIDHQLARHDIDIPAIQRSVARRKI